MPGQATSYMLGNLEIRPIRRRRSGACGRGSTFASSTTGCREGRGDPARAAAPGRAVDRDRRRVE